MTRMGERPRSRFKKVTRIAKPIDAVVEKIAWNALDEIAKGNASAFAYVVVNRDGVVRFGHTYGFDGYVLIGAIEDLKHDLLHMMN